MSEPGPAPAAPPSVPSLTAATVVWEPTPRPGAWNMALDEVLLRGLTPPPAPAGDGGRGPVSSSASEVILRLYRWSSPSVSCGYFERWPDLLRRFPGREPVRRWTGGGTVLHGDEDELTYSLLVSASHPWVRLPPPRAYHAIHRALRDALGRIEPALADRLTLHPGAAPLSPPVPCPGPCFEWPVTDDVVWGTRKVAGAAQRRTRVGLLHQGSVRLPGLGRWNSRRRLRFAAELLAGLRAAGLSPAAGPARRPGGGPDPPARAPSGAERAAAAALAAGKYADPAWREKF